MFEVSVQVLTFVFGIAHGVAQILKWRVRLVERWQTSQRGPPQHRGEADGCGYWPALLWQQQAGGS
jgi:hypothetical protein